MTHTDLDGLYGNCDKCGGSGTYAPAAVRHGNGWSQQMPGPCSACGGFGAIPTPEGARILRLVKRFTRHGRIEGID